jgi:hypothetical protein
MAAITANLRLVGISVGGQLLLELEPFLGCFPERNHHLLLVSGPLAKTAVPALSMLGRAGRSVSKLKYLYDYDPNVMSPMVSSSPAT